LRIDPGILRLAVERPEGGEPERTARRIPLQMSWLRAPIRRRSAATRSDAKSAFSAPARVSALDGALYFHKKLGERFVVMRSARACFQTGR
jgi:hypothetical protein